MRCAHHLHVAVLHKLLPYTLPQHLLCLHLCHGQAWGDCANLVSTTLITVVILCAAAGYSWSSASGGSW